MTSYEIDGDAKFLTMDITFLCIRFIKFFNKMPQVFRFQIVNYFNNNTDKKIKCIADYCMFSDADMASDTYDEKENIKTDFLLQLLPEITDSVKNYKILKEFVDRYTD